MIVLDTNIISEIVRSTPDARVLAWLDAQPASSLFTTAISQAEILYGLALLPIGRRRDDLKRAIVPIFDQDLAGRILSFDSDAASSYSQIVIAR